MNNEPDDKSAQTAQDKELFVERSENADFPEARKVPPRLVRVKHPSIVPYTSTPKNVHLNAKSYHRINPDTVSSRPCTMGLLICVNDYSRFYDENNILKCQRYSTCPSDLDYLKNCSWQKASLYSWMNLGNDGQVHLVGRPCDVLWVRCFEEQEY